jgi:penicillin-binding protein 1A
MSRRERQKRRGRHRGHPLRRRLGLSVVIVSCTAVLAGLGVVGWIVAVAESAPNIDTLKPQDEGANSVVFAADGSRLGFIQSDVLRAPIAGSQMPRVLKQATVAIEDRRFYKHKGVDYWGLIRAAIKDVTQKGKDIQGGSTLTMQLIKTLYLPGYNQHRNIKTKIKQAKLAEELEQKHDKNWILTTYLNDVPYGTVGGQEADGVQAAARMFFDKPAYALTLPEAALLAGLPQAPTLYNPIFDKGAALARRNQVLDSMVTARYITASEAAVAKQAPLGIKINHYFTHRREQYFFDYVLSQLNDKYGAAKVREGGLKIYTSIDLKFQQEARDAISTTLNQPGDPAGALVTIDPRNGYIKAMASSSAYGQTQFNYAAQAHRQPGSTFKVFVLLTALERGINPDTTYYTSKELTPGWLPGYPTYGVKTFGNTYSGSISITQATLKSDNTVFAQLDADLTPEAVKATAVKMGIPAGLLHGYPAEGLGGLTIGVSPLEMARAYATLASGGYRLKPIAVTRVVHPGGVVDDSIGKPQRVKVFDQAVVGEAIKVLHQNILSGTASYDNYGCPGLAGKTGTTTDSKDAWFVGFTPRLSTASWIGYPTPIPMPTLHGIVVQGASFPSFIWKGFMLKAHGSYCGDFPTYPPFVSQPFFGHYASTGKQSTGGQGTSTTPGTTTQPNGNGGATAPGTNGTGTNRDGTGNYTNPQVYQSPPQGPPNNGNGKGKGNGKKH